MYLSNLKKIGLLLTAAAVFLAPLPVSAWGDDSGELRKKLAKLKVAGLYRGVGTTTGFPSEVTTYLFHPDGTFSGTVAAPLDNVPVNPTAFDEQTFVGLWKVVEVDGPRIQIRAMDRIVFVDPDNLLTAPGDCDPGCLIHPIGDLELNTDTNVMRFSFIFAFEDLDPTGNTRQISTAFGNQFDFSGYLRKDSVSQSEETVLGDYGFAIPPLPPEVP